MHQHLPNLQNESTASYLTQYILYFKNFQVRTHLRCFKIGVEVPLRSQALDQWHAAMDAADLEGEDDAHSEVGLID